MKKAFRDIKRGVNKKVLKVPSIEQKVLDATSNDPWGPHGTHLADIAQASRNYHEYQMIMSVVWKRLSDSGKNWRHVYKGLTVLEYLIANGSERVIEDIREHAYQITSLSSFQYIDSTGRDQGSNIRKKSQSLVALVNDKEKIQEAREKAAANRDKLRNTSGYYGSRDEDRNGYGDEKYGYKDDEYRGRSREGYGEGDYGPRSQRSQSSDRDRERAYEDDGHYSSRESNARVEDGSPDVSRLEPKLSGQNLGAPPTYEDAVSESPPTNHQETAVSVAPPPTAASTPPPEAAAPPPAAATPPVTANNEVDAFDFFDPRGESPAAPSAASGSAELDLFGSLSDSFSSNALALVPSEPNNPPTNPNSSHTFVAASPNSQSFDDPFGDGPFRAVPSTDEVSVQPLTTPFGEPHESVATTTANDMEFVDILADILPPTGPSPTVPSQTVFQAQTDQQSTQTVFHSQNGYAPQPNETTFSSSSPGPFGQPSPQTDYASQPNDPFSQTAFPAQPNETAFPSSSPGPFGQPMPQTGQPSLQTGYVPQPNDSFSQTGFTAQPNQTTFPSSFLGPFGQPMPQPSFPAQDGQSVLPPSFPAQGTQSGFPAQNGQSGFPAQNGQAASLPGFPAQNGQSVSLHGFPAQNGQSGFPAQNGQSVSLPGFPAQGSQSVLPPGFPAQGSQSGFLAQGSQSGFPAQGSQSGFSAQGSQSDFPAQGGQPVLPPGVPAQGGQSVLHSSFLAAQGGQPVLPPGVPAQGGQPVLQPSFPAQGSQPVSQPGFPANSGQPVSQPGFAGGQNASLGGFSSQLGTISQAGFPNSNGQHSQPNNYYNGFQPQGSSASVLPSTQVNTTPGSQYNASNFYQQPAVTSSTGALAIVPQQPTNQKFETKSTVWADTLNRGLVNLNISGSKTNPLSDIGIDFEAINRKEKRMEKPSKTPVTSTVTMGKAMGSGSGMGRAGAGALRPAPNTMVGSGMGITPGYGGVNQPMGMNNMPQNMGIGMNIGQGFQMQQPPPAAGFPPGNYNPMMGRGGGYGQQQPYGGYR